MQIKSIAIPRPGFVYMIGSDKFGWYKIGFSKSCDVRVEQLGILLPFKVELFAVWKSYDALCLEKEMHREYATRHVHGEWFAFTEEQRISVISSPTPIAAHLLFPTGYVHKRDILASSAEDTITDKGSRQWKSDRNLEQKRRISAWLKQYGLDPKNPDHVRRAWDVEVAAKKIQKTAPLIVL